MVKVVCIAIRHPTEPNLFLHGLRQDNHRFALPGGHAKPGETDHEAANRELQEETGLKDIKLDKIHDKIYGHHHVVLFSADAGPQGNLSVKNDPDKEFVTFKFLDPSSHGHLHVHADENILVDWMKDNIGKSRSNVQNSVHKSEECVITKSIKTTVEPFSVDKPIFDPKKHDFIVRMHHRGRPVGFLAVTHKKTGLMPFNLEVSSDYRRRGYATEMMNHVQNISGKQIVPSPDMTQDAKSFYQTYSGKLSKAEEDYVQRASHSMALMYPITIGDKRTRSNGIPLHMTAKAFGDTDKVNLQEVHSLIDKHRFSDPIDEHKMMFMPHKLVSPRGEEHHVLLVYGAPHKIRQLREQSQHVGPFYKNFLPHISLDKEDWDRLSKLGNSFTAKEAGIQFHPAELRAGSQVLKTY